MTFPLVRDLAADEIPVTAVCRVLKFSPQAFYAWCAHPVSDQDLVDAYAMNAAYEIHADDPGLGYRVIADELADAGHVLPERRVWKICSHAGRCHPDGTVQTGDLAGCMDLIDPGMTRLLERTGELLPRPDQPLDSPELSAADEPGLQSALDGVNLPAAERQANEAAWVGHVNAPLDQAGLSSAPRWTVATGG